VDAPTLRFGLQSLRSFRLASLTRPLGTTLDLMQPEQTDHFSVTKVFRVYLPIIVIISIIVFCFIGWPVNVLTGMGKILQVETFVIVRLPKGERELQKVCDIKEPEKLKLIEDKLSWVRTPVNSSNWTVKDHKAHIFCENGDKWIIFSKQEIADYGPMPGKLYKYLLNE
jgi:hypothetical protein